LPGFAAGILPDLRVQEQFEDEFLGALLPHLNLKFA
jgi:hypothetical protein